jgi:hypothetical protein
MEISLKLSEASLLEYRFHFDLDHYFRLRDTADPHHRAVAGRRVLVQSEWLCIYALIPDAKPRVT